MEENNEIKEKSIDVSSKYGLFITIFISAWLVGMSIILAGWLIAKQISDNNTVIGVADTVEPEINTPVDITIPESKPQQGNKDAKVTVVEFADFQCPFCGQWHKEIYPKLKSEYIDTGKINFVYWDFAFLGEESFKTAEAGVCAQDQGKFWEYYDYIFNNQKGENEGTFSDEKIKSIAKTLGLDISKFNSCFDSRINKSNVEESSSLATSYNVSSTPTLFINRLPIEGVLPWENYKQIIETELAK